MELEKKLEEFFKKGKLNPNEKKEFWRLVHEAKVKYNSVSKNLAEKFGKIKAHNTCVVSGDGDFVPLVKKVRVLGKNMELWAFRYS